MGLYQLSIDARLTREATAVVRRACGILDAQYDQETDDRTLEAVGVGTYGDVTFRAAFADCGAAEEVGQALSTIYVFAKHTDGTCCDRPCKHPRHVANFVKKFATDEEYREEQGREFPARC